MDARSNYEVCTGEDRMFRPHKWKTRFMELAILVSSWSKDPSTACGAVITDTNNRVISMGFNGFPMHVRDTEERLNDRDLKYELTVHAEVNALLFANRYLKDCSIYVYPMAPCIRCAVQIIQAGITEVYTVPVTEDAESRWGDDIKKTIALFEEVRIKYRELEMP